MSELQAPTSGRQCRPRVHLGGGTKIDHRSPVSTTVAAVSTTRLSLVYKCYGGLVYHPNTGHSNQPLGGYTKPSQIKSPKLREGLVLFDQKARPFAMVILFNRWTDMITING